MTARRTLKNGSNVTLSGESIKLLRTIPVAQGCLVVLIGWAGLIKYGQNIGFAKADIEAGEWVHSHNVELKEVGRLRIL